MRNDASFGQTHDALLLLERRARQADRSLSGEAHSGIAHLQVLSEADQSGKVTVELSADAAYDIRTFTQAWRNLAGLPEGAVAQRAEFATNGRCRAYRTACR